LGYTLLNPPAAMTIDANGIITWTPQQNQSPSTNLVTTVATNTNPYDPVNPHLSATNSFTVTVQEPAAQSVSTSLRGGTLTLSWSSVQGRVYQVQYKDQVTAPSWTALGSGQVGTGGILTVSDGAANQQQRFYRVVVGQ
jgi:hypothetical protein